MSTRKYVIYANLQSGPQGGADLLADHGKQDDATVEINTFRRLTFLKTLPLDWSSSSSARMSLVPRQRRWL